MTDLWVELAEIERMWSALKGGNGDVFRRGLRGEAGPGLHPGDVDPDRGRGAARTGGGNPYHDAEGKFTSAGGSGGKAGRRKRKVRRLHRRLKRRYAALKARHRTERRDVAEKQRARHAAHKAHYDRKEAVLKAKHTEAMRRHGERHEREIGSMERRRERERGREGNASPEDVQKWEAQHIKDVESARKFYRESERPEKARQQAFDRAVLRDDRAQSAADLKDRDARQRRITLRRQREERADFKAAAREEIEVHGGRLKGAKSHADTSRNLPLYGSLPLVNQDGPDLLRRLSPARTHKAGSAEAILRHCLRQLGLTASFRRGELTEPRRLEVLEAIRQYAREWLRHEAEQLVRQYGRVVDDASVRHSAETDDGRTVPGLERSQSALGELQGRSLSAAMQHHVGRFFRRVGNFVRETILAGAMALGGSEELTSDDLAEADRQAQVQVGYLDRFRMEVEIFPPAVLAEPGTESEGAMTAAEFANRAEQYAGSVWGANINARRDKIIRTGRFRAERRMHAKPLGQHDACGTCEGESAKGWVPVGTLLPIGDSECLGIHCDCYFVYRDEAA